MPTILLPLLWLIAVVANISANESVRKEKALTGAVQVFLKFMLTGDVIFLTLSALTTLTIQLVSGYYAGESVWSSSIFSAIGHAKMSYFIRLLMTATASALTSYVWVTVVAYAERYAALSRTQIASSRQWSTRRAYVALVLVCIGSLAFNVVRFFEFELQLDDSEDFGSRPDVVDADDYFSVEMSSSSSSSVQASSFVFVTTWIAQSRVYRIFYAYVVNYLVMFAVPLLALTFFHTRIAQVLHQQQRDNRLPHQQTGSTDSANKSTSTSGSPRSSSSSIFNSFLDVFWRNSVILVVSALFLMISIVELVVRTNNASNDNDNDPGLDLPTFRAFPVSQILLATVGRVTLYSVIFVSMYVGVERANTNSKDEFNVSACSENGDDDVMIDVITVGDAEPLPHKDDQLLLI